MRFHETFPLWAANGCCPVTRESSGPCVEIVDIDVLPPQGVVVLSRAAICGAAAHFGMVEPTVHQRAIEYGEVIKGAAQAYGERIKQLEGLLATYEIPVPPFAALPDEEEPAEEEPTPEEVAIAASAVAQLDAAVAEAKAEVLADIEADLFADPEVPAELVETAEKAPRKRGGK